jgi:ribosomal protein L35
VFTESHVTFYHAAFLSHITECRSKPKIRNVRGTSSDVQELVQVHHLTVLVFKDLLNQ